MHYHIHITIPYAWLSTKIWNDFSCLIHLVLKWTWTKSLTDNLNTKILIEIKRNTIFYRCARCLFSYILHVISDIINLFILSILCITFTLPILDLQRYVQFCDICIMHNDFQIKTLKSVAFRIHIYERFIQA